MKIVIDNRKNPSCERYEVEGKIIEETEYDLFIEQLYDDGNIKKGTIHKIDKKYILEINV